MQATAKEINLCLNCPLPVCDTKNSTCQYYEAETAQQRYYRKLKQDPERLLVMKKKWTKRYIEKKRRRIKNE